MERNMEATIFKGLIVMAVLAAFAGTAEARSPRPLSFAERLSNANAQGMHTCLALKQTGVGTQIPQSEASYDDPYVRQAYVNGARSEGCTIVGDWATSVSPVLPVSPFNPKDRYIGPSR
jgi:hypothetical protein